VLKFPFDTSGFNLTVLFCGLRLLQNKVTKLALSFLATADTCVLPADRFLNQSCNPL